MIRPLCIALALLAACDTREQTLTPDWFVDSADLLSNKEEDELIALLSEFYEHTQIELAAVTISDLDGRPIEAYAAEMFEDWELGTLQTNNGILVVLAVDERQVHIARGMGMAWQMPQFLVDSIATAMASEFGEARYAPGFRTGLSMIMEIAGSVPWTVDYFSMEDILEDGEAAIDRIAALDAELTGFDDDRVIATGPDGHEAILQMPDNAPLLSVEDLLGIHARIIRISPLELRVLGLQVDEPL